MLIILSIINNIIVIFLTLLVSIHLSNIITKFLNKWIKIDSILLLIHLFIISYIYYLVKEYTKIFDHHTYEFVILIGPMIGILSNYFIPILKKWNLILHGKHINIYKL
jgi:hypothetical protein